MLVGIVTVGFPFLAGGVTSVSGRTRLETVVTGCVTVIGRGIGAATVTGGTPLPVVTSETRAMPEMSVMAEMAVIHVMPETPVMPEIRVMPEIHVMPVRMVARVVMDGRPETEIEIESGTRIGIDLGAVSASTAGTESSAGRTIGAVLVGIDQSRPRVTQVSLSNSPSSSSNNRCWLGQWRPRCWRPFYCSKQQRVPRLRRSKLKSRPNKPKRRKHKRTLRHRRRRKHRLRPPLPPPLPRLHCRLLLPLTFCRRCFLLPRWNWLH